MIDHRFPAALLVLVSIALASAAPAQTDPAALLLRGDAPALTGQGPDFVLPDRTITAASVQSRFAGLLFGSFDVVAWQLGSDTVHVVRSDATDLPLPMASAVVFGRGGPMREAEPSLRAQEARTLVAETPGVAIAYGVSLVPEPGFAVSLAAGLVAFAGLARVRQRHAARATRNASGRTTPPPCT